MRVADQLEKDDALRRQVKSAMVYPARRHHLRAARPASAWSPSSSRCSSASSSSSAATCRRSPSSPSRCRTSITGYWWACIAVAVGVVVRLPQVEAAPSGAARSGTRSACAIPMKIGDIVQKVALARWSRTLSRARHRRRAAPAGARDHRQDRRQRASSRRRWPTSSSRSSAAARSPTPLKRRLRSSRRWSPTWSASARRPAPWTRCSRRSPTSTRTRSTAAVKALTSILEPVMIVVVGGIVGFIVISMYMPLFKVYDQIR